MLGEGRRVIDFRLNFAKGMYMHYTEGKIWVIYISGLRCYTSGCEIPGLMDFQSDVCWII